MTIERPPRDASVDNLLELCEALREGEKSREELLESVDQGKTLVRDNIRYGIGLGFISESEDGVKATSRGIEASYNRDAPEMLAEQFKNGLGEFQLYRSTLNDLVSEGFSEDGSPIKKSDVLRVFRTSLGLEGSENTLSGAATTFIDTLQAAGLGEYIIGRGGNESRLEINEEFGRSVEEILRTEDAEDGTDEEESEKSTGVSGSQNKQVVGTTPRQTKTTEVPLDIQVELSGDEDPNKVEELIVGIRRGLARDLDLSEPDSDEGDTGDEDLKKPEDVPEQELKDDSESNDEKTSSDQSLDTFVESKSADEEV